MIRLLVAVGEHPEHARVVVGSAEQPVIGDRLQVVAQATFAVKFGVWVRVELRGRRDAG